MDIPTDNYIEFNIPHLYERLIEALGSPVLQVRQIALQALHIQTGQSKGFQPNAPEDQRRRQIEEWRRWLVQYRASVGS